MVRTDGKKTARERLAEQYALLIVITSLSGSLLPRVRKLFVLYRDIADRHATTSSIFTRDEASFFGVRRSHAEIMEADGPMDR